MMKLLPGDRLVVGCVYRVNVLTAGGITICVLTEYYPPGSTEDDFPISYYAVSRSDDPYRDEGACYWMGEDPGPYGTIDISLCEIEQYGPEEAKRWIDNNIKSTAARAMHGLLDMQVQR